MDLRTTTGRNACARPMRRTIEQAVENPLAAMLVRAEFKSGDRVVIAVKDQALSFSLNQ